MTVLPDSGVPGDELSKLNLPLGKPELLTDATWRHLTAKYQLLGELGEGGQGRVFKVKETLSPFGRRAIKVYHEDSTNSRKLFDHECSVLISPHLPSDLIVRYFSHVNDTGIQPYIVMESIDGETITKAANWSMSVSERIDLWERVLLALDRLHQSNLVFGDVSANNIMVQHDGRIRFVDLAGAKNLEKGIHRQESSVNIGTHSTMPHAWNEKEIRSSKITDIYAVSAIGFLILTGKKLRDVQPADREQLLREKEIPAAVSAFVLRGLSEPQKAKLEDPRLYRTVGDIASDISDWRASVIRRRQQFRQGLLTMALMLVVGVPGFIGWQLYWREAAASDRQVWNSLDAQIRELPNLNHPAVARLVADVVQLRDKRDTADAGIDPLAAQKARAELLSKSRDLLRVAREIDAADKQRLAMGRLLLEESATADSGLWVKAAPVIEARLAELAARYTAIGQQIDAGETERLADDLAMLQTDLAELFQVNIEARAALDVRIAFERVRQQVPERLHDTDGFLSITQAAEKAQAAWDVRFWDGGSSLGLARAQFGLATQQLNEWLPKNLTAEESASIEANIRKRVTELAVERENLLKEIEGKSSEVQDLNQQVATLNKKRLEDEEVVTEAKRAIVREGIHREILEQTTTKLATAETELAARNAEIVEFKKSDLAAERENHLADIEAQSLRIDDLNKQMAALNEERLANQKLLSATAGALTDEEAKRKAAEVRVANLVQVESDLAALKDKSAASVMALDAARKSLTEVTTRLAAAEKDRDKFQADSDQLRSLARSSPSAGKASERVTTTPISMSSPRVNVGDTPGERLTITLTSSVKLPLIWCPPGKLEMGTHSTNDFDSRLGPPEIAPRPAEVTLKTGYWMARTETTQAQWTAVMRTMPWITHGSEGTYKAGDNFPAIYIDHTMARTFCDELNSILGQTSGLKFSLPTETQWEYGCRAGTPWDYSFGNNIAELDDYAWYDNNALYQDHNYAHEVATKRPNLWGLCDMHANTWEWTSDWHDWSSRILRGGSWANGPLDARSTSMSHRPPESCNRYTGFRVVAE